MYCSLDRKTDDGKDITDVGYIPGMGSLFMYPEGIESRDIIEFDNEGDVVVVSLDLPFITTILWSAEPRGSDFYFDNQSLYGRDYDGWYKQYASAFCYHLLIDMPKPFVLVSDFLSYGLLHLQASIDNDNIEYSLFGNPRLPGFIKKLGIQPTGRYLKLPSFSANALKQGSIYYRTKYMGDEKATSIFSGFLLDGHPYDIFSDGSISSTVKILAEADDKRTPSGITDTPAYWLHERLVHDHGSGSYWQKLSLILK